VKLSTNNGGSYTTLGSGLSASTRSFSFTPSSSQVTTSAVIWVQALDASSNGIASGFPQGTFTIANGSATAGAPVLSNDAPLWDAVAPAGPAVNLHWTPSTGS